MVLCSLRKSTTIKWAPLSWAAWLRRNGRSLVGQRSVRVRYTRERRIKRYNIKADIHSRRIHKPHSRGNVNAHSTWESVWWLCGICSKSPHANGLLVWNIPIKYGLHTIIPSNRWAALIVFVFACSRKTWNVWLNTCTWWWVVAGNRQPTLFS